MPLARFVSVAILCCSALAPAFGQESSWRSFASVTPIFEGDADLDRGGEFSVLGVVLRVGSTRAFEGGNTFGVTLNYDYYDFSFYNAVSFGGVAPWNKVQRYGVSAFAIRDFGGGNRLGFGVSAFAHIEDTKVFPLLLVDWSLGQRWRLINPLPMGPSGPAGFELDYVFDNNWRLGIGGAYRVNRFRLSETGPVANGVGEMTGVPIFLRETRSLGDSLPLNLNVGAVAQGRLRVEDRNGNLLREDDFGLAPLFALTALGRF